MALCIGTGNLYMSFVASCVVCVLMLPWTHIKVERLVNQNFSGTPTLSVRRALVTALAFGTITLVFKERPQTPMLPLKLFRK